MAARSIFLPAVVAYLGTQGSVTDNGLDESTLRCSTSAQCAGAMK